MDSEAAVIRAEMSQTKAELDYKISQLQRKAKDMTPRSVVETVPGVVGSEKIRTRGTADTVFVDLHLWVDPRTPLGEAHALSHVVKDRLMARYPQIADAIIHIEPPPDGMRAG